LKNSQTLHISKEKLYEVKKQLLSFDREQYGFNWLVYSPLCGHGCWQTIYSMYVTSKGYVQPCADIDISFYNIRDLSLADILKKNFFQLARTIEKRVSGICSICSHKNACIGCRGIAFSHGRNIGLSPEEALCLEDPYCPLKKAELDS
jgi:radical SAM protein with 4Fe4S-binding SPASM domain